MNVARTIVGWLTPVLILAAGFAVFRFLGSQPPPERKQADKSVAAAVRAVEAIRERSEILRKMEADGAIKIVGAYYDLGSGEVSLLP